jgi:hypothetical protein
MGLKVQSIIDFVRRKLHETDPEDSRFSDEPDPQGKPDLIGFINDSVPEICAEIKYCRKAVRIEGTGQNNYPLPEDLIEIEQMTSLGIRIEWLTIADSAPYSPLEPLQANLFAGGYGAVIKGDQVFFLPTLNSGEQRVLHYIGMEDEVLSADATMRAPRYLRDVYGYYVLSACYEAVRDSFWAEKSLGRAMALIRRRRGNERRRQYPGMRQMKVPRGRGY